MYFAELDEKNMVIRVIRADKQFINKQPGKWIIADYLGKNPKNYPGIEYTYVPILNAYIPPKPNHYCELNSEFSWTQLKQPKRLKLGEKEPGFYEENLVDSNGKQLYERIVFGIGKNDYKLQPIKIQGRILDIRK